MIMDGGVRDRHPAVLRIDQAARFHGTLFQGGREAGARALLAEIKAVQGPRGEANTLDPYDRLIAESNRIDDDLVVADLNAALLDRCTGRRWIRTRRPELYGPLTQPTGKEEPTRKVRFEK